MSQKETLVSRTYDLLKYTIPLLNRLPKSQKFTLGDRIQQLMNDLLELYIEAYYAPADEKRPRLLRANIQLEKLRHYLRLAFELNYLSSGQYREFAERTTEIGKMTGGWLKSLQQ